MRQLPPGIAAADLDGITDVTHDSNAVTPGMLYACVVGRRFDGHDFAPQAVEQGAVALLVERELELPDGVAQFVVPNVRAAMGTVAAHVHGWPAERLSMVGITGTNGKTTTTHLLASLLRGVGHSTAQLGTLSGVRTTPESPDLQRFLAERVDAGDDSVVMEVSSHALVEHRVDGCEFDVAVFTNLGRDHLDLHGTVEDYFRAKATLFDPALARAAVLNRDDTHGRLLIDSVDVPVHPFSVDDVTDERIDVNSLSFRWRGEDVRVPIGGRFNLSNALAALEAAVVLGVDPGRAASAIGEIPPVPGRFETIENDRGFAVVVDYAHTPDGLDELLSAARALEGSRRVILVFGCGGDRDSEKRPLMGRVAERAADVVIVTSDNPRHENPLSIIEAAVAGMSPDAEPIIEPDRTAAIRRAIELAAPHDVIVIAGKGHETTQTIGDTAHPFDDRAVARQLLEETT